MVADYHTARRAGVDPIAREHAAKAERIAKQHADIVAAITFEHAVERYLDAHSAKWKNLKHRAQWHSTLATYAFPTLGPIPVAKIDTNDVLAVLSPIWLTKTETASRLRGRIEAVLDYATTLDWRAGANPARWKGHMAIVLPKPSKVAKVEHHAALPWKDIAAFMSDLRGRHAMAARALEWAILTAARTGEVLGAKWSEIDLDGALWTLPAERMKSGLEHRVPLSPPALALLTDMAEVRDSAEKDRRELVFPGRSGPLSGMSMLMLLRRMERDDLTVHGFRSTFRDWVSEATNHPRELAETALAHVVADKTEAAYRRGESLAKRAILMTDWGRFCDGLGEKTILLGSTSG